MFNRIKCLVFMAGFLVFFTGFIMLMPGSAYSADIAILSNDYFAGAAADFTANIPGHTFTGIDVSTVTPSLAQLSAYDAVLLFEDGTFGNAVNVGNVVEQYANTGSAVILGTFYNQDRSDSCCGGDWGALETIDPNTSDGVGTSYDGDTLDAGSIVPHALTTGVTSLWTGLTGFSGGNEAKAGTTVLALWSNLNDRGNPDPAIAYRVTGPACVIHIGIAPHYEVIEDFGVEFGGDFYQAWTNAFDFAAGGCGSAPSVSVPTMTHWGMIIFIVLAGIGSIYFIRRRRITG